MTIDIEPLGLRPARIDDLSFIFEGELAYIRAIEPDREPAWISALGTSLELWIDGLGRTTVAELDGRPVGYQMWRPEGAYALLSALSVSPVYRNQRIGRALLQHFVDEASD